MLKHAILFNKKAECKKQQKEKRGKKEKNCIKLYLMELNGKICRTIFLEKLCKIMLTYGHAINQAIA